MLHVDLPGTTRGGVAHQVSRLADALGRRGHQVVAFSFGEQPRGVAYGVHTIRAPALVGRTKTGWLAGGPIAFAARSYRGFDVVHAHGDSFLLWRRQPPVVRTFYGSAREEARHAERLRRRAVQTLLVRAEQVARRAATVTVGISANTQASVGRLDAVVPCGVDRRLFRPGPKSPAPSVLFVGTLGGRKRGGMLVRAFRECVRPHVPDAELWLVADGQASGDGVRSFGLLGDEELARLFREAWVFCLPSSYEGFGVPYVEAMASGTAVVATPNAGSVEIVGPATGGLVVSEAEVAPAVVSLLQDGARRRELEATGREASARFDWDRVCAAYEDLYHLAIRRAERRTGAVEAAPEERTSR